jgi:molybdopterin-guanine dinucleotide biosynthesis protein A
MGRDKAFLEIRGRPLIDVQLEKAKWVAANVFISTNNPDPYRALGAAVVRDAYPGRGPLAGVHAGLMAAPDDLVLVLACDLPGVGQDLITELVRRAASCDAVAPRSSDGRLHPLCAVYRRLPCLRASERCLHTGRNAMSAFLAEPGLKVEVLSPGDHLFRDADLININTLNDLNAFLSPA